MTPHRILLPLFAAAAGLIGTAHAQSSPRTFYAQCLSDAREERDSCRRSRNGHERCGDAYRYDKDACWQTYQGLAQSNPYGDWIQHGGYTGLYSPRFVPLPIPQRPTYILPGVK